MPIFNDYSKEGKLLSTRDVPLDATSLPRYLEECGKERAKGYQDALNDLIQEIYDQAHMPAGDGIRVRADSAVVRILFKFLDNKKELSNAISQSLHQHEGMSANNPSPASNTKVEF